MNSVNAYAALQTPTDYTIHLWLAAIPAGAAVLSLLAALSTGGESSWLMLRRRQTRRPRWLRPSTHVTVAEVLRLGHFPLDPATRRSGRRGLVRRLRLGIMRPSTPKPVLLLNGRPTVETSPEKQRQLGGRRLVLKPYPTESAWHLWHSIRSAGRRNATALMIASIQDYLAGGSNAQMYTVAPRRTALARDERRCVITYTADPNSLKEIDSSDTPNSHADSEAVWLLYDDSPSNGAEPAAAPPSACTSRPKLEGESRDPWDGPRLYRHIALLLLVALSAAGWWLVFVRDWGTAPSTAMVVTVSALAMVTWYLTLILALYNAVAYLWQELRHAKGWTATTTLCLVDGRSVRDGYYRDLWRRNRYRVSMRM